MSEHANQTENDIKNTEERPDLSDEQLDGASGGYKVTFSDLVISSFQTGGSSGVQVEKPSEKLELNERNVDDLGMKHR